MPTYKKRGKRSSYAIKRRQSRKNYTRGKKRVIYSRRNNQLKFAVHNNQPLPDKYMTKLRFTDFLNVPSSGSSGIVDTILRGNGLYDPEYTWGGRGAAAFTQLAGIYTNYRVYAARVKIQIKSINDTTALGDSIALLLANRGTTPLTMSTAIPLMSTPYSKYCMVNRFANGNSPQTLTLYRRTKDLFGESDIDDDAYSSGTGTTPANEWYIHLAVMRGDQSAISAAPGFQVILSVDYYVRFEKRRDLAAP